jgi:hypothetical protein
MQYTPSNVVGDRNGLEQNPLEAGQRTYKSTGEQSVYLNINAYFAPPSSLTFALYIIQHDYHYVHLPLHGTPFCRLTGQQGAA